MICYGKRDSQLNKRSPKLIYARFSGWYIELRKNIGRDLQKSRGDFQKKRGVIGDLCDTTPTNYEVLTYSSNADHPFEGVILRTVLNGLQLVIEPGRQFTGLTFIDFVTLAFKKQLSDGGDYSGCSSAENLL